mmetsp:Transcript_47308/g.86891  ORF Transcript_47308/g.86891 Transcript_47308/m.86891 type:complete len:270 (-) Transcript_47308:26-835(-)
MAPSTMKPLRQFRPFKLLAKETLTEGSEHGFPVRRFTFELPADVSLHTLGFDLGLGDFVQVKPPNSRARSYSPTSDVRRSGSFDLTVKLYRNGACSGYLDSLQVGDEAQISGPAPVPWLAYTLHQTKHVGIIAFGVGITEALPVAAAQLAKAEVAKVILLWGNKAWSDVFWQKDLQALSDKSGDRMETVLALSREDHDGCIRSRIDEKLLQSVFSSLPPASSFLVVGTKGMKKQTFRSLAALGYSSPPLLQKKLRPLPCFWRSRAPAAE